MDQQYNALNFIYYVKRADGPPPSYELKLCTNRLSFFIDDYHGYAVFPENIEYYFLSLLVNRQITIELVGISRCRAAERKRW